MTDKEIKILRRAVKDGVAYWVPDSSTAHKVIAVGRHAEEGDDEPCAIFEHGKYVALYNCPLTDFKALTSVLTTHG